MVKNMAIFHNTDTIILCGLDVLDLTGKQNWAASIFSHQAFNNLIQAVALPWGNLLKKLSGRNSVILSFWLSCGLFFLPPSHFSFEHLFKCLFSFSFSLPATHLHFQPSQLFHFLLSSPAVCSGSPHTPTSNLNHTPGTQLSNVIERWPFTAVFFSCRDCV